MSPDDTIMIGAEPADLKSNQRSVLKVNRYETAVDWLSLTGKAHKFGEISSDAFRAAKRKGGPWVEPWSHQGGYTGERIGAWKWGHSDLHGYLLIVSGSDSDDLVRYLGARHFRDFRVTRIDLRTDIWLDEPHPDLAAQLYEPRKHNKQPSCRLVSSPTGATIYVGSPASDMFARIYDKGGKNGGDLGAHWRYEIVIRKPYADEVYDRLRDRHLGDRKVHVAIRDFVYSWLQDRGIPMPVEGKWHNVPKLQSSHSTEETKLAWLRKGVSGTVQRLVDAGYEQEVREALGLP